MIGGAPQADSMYALRDVIGTHMVQLGERDDRVVVVNADLSGTCRTTSFAERFPERSFNVGIAEQNAVSFAAGLAHEGFIPYVFSMAPFISMRACEQCRTDVAYASLPVRLIGVYAGVSGGISGATHWALEDVGIMTSMPNMSVYEVSDPCMAESIMDYSLTDNGPMYIRCTIEPVSRIYENPMINAGGSLVAGEGKDGAFLCSGIAVQNAVNAAEILRARKGLDIGVTDLYSIKPIDREAIMRAAGTGHVVVAQDHNIFGGLGAQVLSVIAEEGLGIRCKTVGIPDRFVPMGHAPYLYKQFGMDADGLADNMLSLFE